MGSRRGSRLTLVDEHYSRAASYTVIDPRSAQIRAVNEAKHPTGTGKRRRLKHASSGDISIRGLNTRRRGEDYGLEPTIAHPNGYLVNQAVATRPVRTLVLSHTARDPDPPVWRPRAQVHHAGTHSAMRRHLSSESNQRQRAIRTKFIANSEHAR